MSSDDEFMQEALSLALKARPSPNPRVGCVIVKKGKIIGKGYHRFFGDAHAEVHALRSAGSKAKGATMYVTLEPCNHQGKTPPCTRAIKQAGIKRLVAAMQDPHSLVKGRGIRALRNAGVKVEVGLGREAAKMINRFWIKYAQSGIPFIALKAAQTLDGKLAAKTGDSKWITSPQSRRFAHCLRDRYDAIIVGVQTIIADNPRLTARIKGGRNPIKVVFDSSLRTPTNSNILKAGKTIILTTQGVQISKIQRLEKAGVKVLQISNGKEVNLRKGLKALAKLGITSALVEGGPRIHSSFIRQKLPDIGYFFVAPRIAGGKAIGLLNDLEITRISQAKQLKIISVSRVGSDVLLKVVF